MESWGWGETRTERERAGEGERDGEHEKAAVEGKSLNHSELLEASTINLHYFYNRK